MKPKLGLSGRNYGRVVYEALKGGLDFTKDDENINSQPFMHWRDRFLYCMEAVEQGDGRDRRGEGHTISTSPPAPWRTCTSAPNSPSELGSVIVMIDLVIGYTAIQSMAKWARRNDMILHLHRAGHSTYTRQKNHGISFRVIAKWMRMAGVDHIHAGTVVGKLEGDPNVMRGYLRHAAAKIHVPQKPRARHFLRSALGEPEEADAGRLGRHSCRPDASAADLSRRGRGAAVRRRHHRPSHGHLRPAPPPTASRSRRWSRRATKAATSGTRGPQILAQAARWCPPLRAALDTWRDVTFDYASTDSVDFVPTPTVAV